MTIATEFLIAIKYLRARKKEALISVTAWLALLGIMIGVAALVVVMSVMNGYRAELMSKLKGVNSDITITHSNKIANYERVARKVAQIQDVKAVFPLIESQGLIASGKISRGIIIKAINFDSIASYPILSSVSSNPKSFSRPDGIFLGANLALALDVGVGDVVKLVSPEVTSTIIGTIPNAKDFYVDGIFKSGLNDYDNVYAIIPLAVGQVFFNLDSSVNKFEIFTRGEDDIHKTSAAISNALQGKYFVQNWQTSNKFLFHALKTERTVMFVILTFIIIVAVFNIISSLTMLVLCKAREIAILRTIGFSKSAIMRIFLICGMLLGGFGTVLGVSLGFLFASHINAIKNFLSLVTGTDLFNPVIYYLEALPSKIEMSDITRIAVTAFVLTIVAALYPSYKASKIQPAQGLKND